VVDEHETALRAALSTPADSHVGFGRAGAVEVTTFPASSTATHNASDTHDTAKIAFPGSTEVKCHAPAPPVGFVETSTFPESSTATQNEGLEHEIPLMNASPSTFTEDQAPAPPVGFVDVSTSPASSPAAQNVVVGHETPKMASDPSTFEVVQADAPPVGSLLVTTSPVTSVATHRPVPGHDIPSKVAPVACTTLHVRGPLVGFLVVRTFPMSSTAAHKLIEGQETPYIGTAMSAWIHADAPAVGSTLVQNWLGVVVDVVATQNGPGAQDTAENALLPPTTVDAVHAGPPPAGSVEVRTFPPLSTATHSDTDLHDRPEIVWPSSMVAGVVHPGLAAVGLADASTEALVPEEVWSSNATHSFVEGHDTPETGLETAVDFQSVATVVVGSVVAYMSPPEPMKAAPTATQVDAEAQETPDREGPTVIVFQTASIPSAGSVDVAIRPSSVVATHSVVVGQEIPKKPIDPGSTDFMFHAAAPPVGLVDVTTLPAPSTATHKFSDGHEIACSWRRLVSTPDVTRHACEGSVEVMTSLDASIPTHRAADGHETPCANAGGEGLGSGSAGPKLHASGDGVSASAVAATRPAMPRLATTAKLTTSERLTGAHARERGSTPSGAINRTTIRLKTMKPPVLDWPANLRLARSHAGFAQPCDPTTPHRPGDA
jgi:hypothetical protein